VKFANTKGKLRDPAACGRCALFADTLRIARWKRGEVRRSVHDFVAPHEYYSNGTAHGGGGERGFESIPILQIGVHLQPGVEGAASTVSH